LKVVKYPMGSSKGKKEKGHNVKKCAGGTFWNRQMALGQGMITKPSILGIAWQSNKSANQRKPLRKEVS